MRKNPVWAISFGLLLTWFTLYVVFDVFIFARPMQENATAMNLAMFEGVQQAETSLPEPQEPADDGIGTEEVQPGTLVDDKGEGTLAGSPSEGAPVDTIKEPEATPSPTPIPSRFSKEEIITENYYSNDHLAIEITEYREHNTQIHVAEIWVSSAQYIMTAFAKDTYGRNIVQKTSKMAASKNAIFAVNGDNYGSREGGYVIRNGILYRKAGNKTKDVLCIMPDGDFMFSHSNKASAQSLLDAGAWQVLTFGPVLLDNGEFMVNTKSEVDLCYVTNPRSAIGMVEPLHYYVVVADGRTKVSHGLTLYEVADFMKRLGCVKAYNLDGGGSSTMVFQGRIINYPTSEGSFYEREVTDIVYLR